MLKMTIAPTTREMPLMKTRSAKALADIAFQMVWMASALTKETGSGVGLAIAERVVSAHHGRITVDSEEGRGTTITITLPTDKAGLAVLPRWTSAERT